MEDFMFVVKSLAFTVLIVFLMQIRVGGQTIEASSLGWMQNSVATETLRGVADGGIKVVSQGYHWLTQQLGLSTPSADEPRRKSHFSRGDWHSREGDESSSDRHARTAPRESSADGAGDRDVKSKSTFRWSGEAKDSRPEADQID